MFHPLALVARVQVHTGNHDACRKRGLQPGSGSAAKPYHHARCRVAVARQQRQRFDTSLLGQHSIAHGPRELKHSGVALCHLLEICLIGDVGLIAFQEGIEPPREAIGLRDYVWREHILSGLELYLLQANDVHLRGSHSRKKLRLAKVPVEHLFRCPLEGSKLLNSSGAVIEGSHIHRCQQIPTHDAEMILRFRKRSPSRQHGREMLRHFLGSYSQAQCASDRDS
mmetsp:Transcript_28776/g.58979  ORF Transcript_28776/g.58979 Transcript_28776/m.58979 type:complete len:225 (-) Transcript_28776:69-743(-)